MSILNRVLCLSSLGIIALVAACAGAEDESSADESNITQSGDVPVWDRCETDRDCVAVKKESCCEPNAKEAVNEDQVAAYEASFDPRTCLTVKCAPPPPADTRAPLCNTTQHRCEMVEPKDIACGGHTTNPHECPDGFNCTGKALLVDGTGSCKPK